MCVACRTSRPADELLRFARAPDGSLGFDVRGKLSGRGAWTCASPACVQKAIDKGGFERAFEAPVLTKGLAAAVGSILETEVLQGLGLLRRAGRLVAGREEVARNLGAATALVVARDLSARTRGDVDKLGVVAVPGPNMDAIGKAIGRKPTGVLAALGGPASDRLVKDLRRLADWAATFTSTSLAEGQS
jgi:predicted RNA-binding protein YlxR (DUF448 family)